jgi:hypothetical protein
MRNVTGQAILLRRRMSPEKGTAPFGVAFETELIHIFSDKHFVCCTAMGIVTISAAHFPFRNWHVRTAMKFCLDILMALEASGFLINLLK